MSWHGKNATDVLANIYNQGGGAYIVTIPPHMPSGEQAWADILIVTKETVSGQDKVVIWYLEYYIEALERSLGEMSNTDLINELGSACWVSGGHGFKPLGRAKDPNRREFWHRDNLIKPDTNKEHIILGMRYALAMSDHSEVDWFKNYAEFGDYIRSSEFKRRVNDYIALNSKEWRYKVGVKIKEISGMPRSLTQ